MNERNPSSHQSTSPANKSIVFVTMSLDVGGTERHLISVLPALKNLGYDIQVWLMLRKGSLAESLEKKGILVKVMIPEFGFWASILKKSPNVIRRILRIFFAVFSLTINIKKTSPHILHFFLPEPYILGTLAAKCARFKGALLMSRRSVNRYQKKYWGSRFLESRCHANAHLIMGNCQAILDELVLEGVQKEKLRLTYNGIDLTPFSKATFSKMTSKIEMTSKSEITSKSEMKSKAELRLNLGIAPESLVFIMVANFHPYKGHMDLLMSFAKIQDQLPKSWQLILVGGGSSGTVNNQIESQLKYFAKTKNIDSHILWCGVRKDIPDLLKASDIGILCSHEEGFSNAILEGMASSLPMIVTDVGGNKEAVIHEETGIIVKPHDQISLSQAILKCANNREYARTLGEKGRMRVESEFSFQASINTYHKIYQSLHFVNNNNREDVQVSHFNQGYQ